MSIGNGSIGKLLHVKVVGLTTTGDPIGILTGFLRLKVTRDLSVGTSTVSSKNNDPWDLHGFDVT